MSYEVLTHSTDEYDLQPGQSCTMTARARLALLPGRVVFASLLDAAFAIRLVHVGNRSIMRGAGCRIPVHGGRMEMLAEEINQWLFLADPIRAGQDFRIDIENTSRVPSPFRADWLCEHVIEHQLGGERFLIGTEPAKAGQAIAYRPERIHIAPAASPNPLERLRRESGHSAAAWAPARSDRPRLATRTPPGFGWDPDE